MALTQPGLTGAISGSLLSTGHTGIAMPLVATGVAAGIMLWIPTVQVVTTDVGTTGAGAGVTTLVVPPSLLTGNMTIGFASSVIVGPFVPASVVGFSNGIALGLLQGQVVTTHPVVGAGSGVCKFVAPPAGPQILAGLASVGVIGLSAVQTANAIGLALDMTFLSLVLPTPIVGPPSPTTGGGAGFGKIV